MRIHLTRATFKQSLESLMTKAKKDANEKLSRRH